MINSIVFFDIYQTLLEVDSRNIDHIEPEEYLETIRPYFASPDGLPSLPELLRRVRELIRTEQNAAHGISHPEVQWGHILHSALPKEFAGQLSEEQIQPFAADIMRLQQNVRLFPNAEKTLEAILKKSPATKLGLLSNAQHYTLLELENCLKPVGLSLEIFDPEFTFLSFRFGFSKPGRYPFRMMTARATEQRIPLSNILMVGDKLDNDIEPARASGWKTFHLRPDAASTPGGNHLQLIKFLEAEFFKELVSEQKK
ncbi:MAG: HAD family hydrolase [Chthoniobacterales bacterium]